MDGGKQEEFGQPVGKRLAEYRHQRGRLGLWKDVSGLTDLNSSVASSGANWWDRAGNGESGTTATRIRYKTGQITTDNPMPLLALGATSATISWDYAPDSVDYNVGLYYSADADASLMVLPGIYNGSQPVANQWQSGSVTITDGVQTVPAGLHQPLRRSLPTGAGRQMLFPVSRRRHRREIHSPNPASAGNPKATTAFLGRPPFSLP